MASDVHGPCSGYRRSTFEFRTLGGRTNTTRIQRNQRRVVTKSLPRSPSIEGPPRARSTTLLSQPDKRSGAGFIAACAGALVLASTACGPDEPPAHPDWATVQPILRAECSGCHGATAGATGSGYRFDFYDMTDEPCGEAAAPLVGTKLAHAQANDIALAITTTDPNVRPSMPPVPAPYLSDNEWLTILRWTANPIKGDKPENNRPPHITVDGTPTAADQTLSVNIVVTDPEGDPVVGVLKTGNQVEKMDHAGAFATQYDTSSWPAGAIVMSAVLCDGWSKVSVDLLEITIHH